MRILIFVGTGGVGKTSVASAAGLRAAERGDKTLILTIDPARRLKTALRLDRQDGQHRIALSPGSKGELWAAMMDVRAVLDRAVRIHAKPAEARRVLRHPIYQVLISSLSGMQELVAVERLDQAIGDGFDTIVVDTAPSRHALEFLDKPEFFVQLASFPAVRLVGRTFHLWEKTPFSRLGRRGLEVYSRVESILGTNLIRQILDFYSVFLTVAEGYASRAKKTSRIFRDPDVTSFAIVTTPFKAGRDTGFFLKELRQRRFPVRNLVINRTWSLIHPESMPAGPPLAARSLAWYHEIRSAQALAIDEMLQEFAEGAVPNIVQLPELVQDVDGLPALKEIADRLDLV
jgi:anion-transporting  ArsA/GET3 family ATPase